MRGAGLGSNAGEDAEHQEVSLVGREERLNTGLPVRRSQERVEQSLAAQRKLVQPGEKLPVAAPSGNTRTTSRAVHHCSASCWAVVMSSGCLKRRGSVTIWMNSASTCGAMAMRSPPASSRASVARESREMLGVTSKLG